MSKPWEETWDAVLAPESAEHLSAVFCEGERAATVSGETNTQEHARVRLIAAAPELARALLAVEWVRIVDPRDGNNDAFCPSCRHVDCLPHADDCALDAALRKAGVR